MISSEVHRTLVKSPPELWAELSDPAALARHLGELGEIRITRTEPEKLVEWEAEGTTGSVAIKSSGWGTKVTLKVDRELPDGLDTDRAESESRGAADPATDAAPATDPRAATDPGTSTDGESSPSVSPAAHGGPLPRVRAELDLWASLEMEQAGRPILTAAERSAPEEPRPLLGTQLAVDAAELEIVEAEGVGDESSAPHAHATTGDGGAGLLDAQSATPTEEESTAAERPRRGFLARLFGSGRGRSRRTDRKLESQVTPAEDAATPPLAEASPVLVTPPPSGEPDRPVFDERPPADRFDDERTSSATAVLALPVPASTERADVPPPAEPAAELRAAEESAAQDVTVLLTAVLDRLGAAHHRPFSRS